MASPPDTDVHMEAMEEVKDEGREPEEVGNPGKVRLHVGEHPIGVLESCKVASPEPFHNK